MTDLQPARQIQRQALEARFALRVTAALDAHPVQHDIEQRLRVARELAVARARHARLAATEPVVGVQRGAAVLGSTPWWARLASGLPLLLLAAGLLLIERLDHDEQIRAAAEVDAVLLADELPPRAYSDPGFSEFLKQPPAP